MCGDKRQNIYGSGLRVFLALVAVLLVGGAAGCGPGKPAITPSAEGVDPVVYVDAVDNRFQPQVVTVRVGEAVRWNFVGGAKHDVVADNGSFVSELLPRGNSFTHVFTEAGTFEYRCSIHPEMRGRVVVEG